MCTDAMYNVSSMEFFFLFFFLTYSFLLRDRETKNLISVLVKKKERSFHKCESKCFLKTLLFRICLAVDEAKIRCVGKSLSHAWSNSMTRYRAVCQGEYLKTLKHIFLRYLDGG